MMKRNPILREHIIYQSEGNIVSNMDGEKVMLSIQNGKYYNLGEMGGEIWDCMKTPIKVKEIINLLMTRYDVERDECEDQVIAFLGQLLAEGIVHVREIESFKHLKGWK